MFYRLRAAKILRNARIDKYFSLTRGCPPQIGSRGLGCLTLASPIAAGDPLSYRFSAASRFHEYFNDGLIIFLSLQLPPNKNFFFFKAFSSVSDLIGDNVH